MSALCQKRTFGFSERSPIARTLTVLGAQRSKEAFHPLKLRTETASVSADAGCVRQIDEQIFKPSRSVIGERAFDTWHPQPNR